VVPRERLTPSQPPPLRVVIWGLGAMGRLMARLVLADPDLRLVGAVTRQAGASGAPSDLAGLLGLEPAAGIPLSPSLDRALERAGGANVVLHATGSFVAEVAGQIEACLEAGLDVVTIAEEMAFPWAQSPDLAARLDRLARERGHTVVGTGVNPGFVLDTLVVLLTAVTGHVQSVYGRRVNDLSPYGPTVMRTQGVGLDPDEFARRVADGTVVGHVGFPESIHLIARALGVKVTRVEESREPIISTVRRVTPHVVVEPGYVAGCRHVARGWSGDLLLVELEHPQQVRPEAEGVETGDYIEIRGWPDITVRTGPEIPGGIATAAITVNLARPVVQAPPGLLTMLDLPLPRGTARRRPEVLRDVRP